MTPNYPPLLPLYQHDCLLCLDFLLGLFTGHDKPQSRLCGYFTEKVSRLVPNKHRDTLLLS